MLAIAAAAATDDETVIAHLQFSFFLLASGQADPATVDLAGTIVSEVVKHGGEAEYQMVLAMYKAPPTPQHQLAAIAGLTSTRSPALGQPTAGMLMSGQVADQNMAQFLMGLAANPVSRRLVWQFVQMGWAGLEAKLAGSSAPGLVVKASFESFSSEEDADAVEAFFADKDTTTFSQALHQGPRNGPGGRALA